MSPPVPQYLESVRPLLDDDKYREMEALAKEFQEKTAPRLQRYLRLKSWWTTNYVSLGTPGDSGDTLQPSGWSPGDLGCLGWSRRGQRGRYPVTVPLFLSLFPVPFTCPHLCPFPRLLTLVPAILLSKCHSAGEPAFPRNKILICGFIKGNPLLAVPCLHSLPFLGSEQLCSQLFPSLLPPLTAMELMSIFF